MQIANKVPKQLIFILLTSALLVGGHIVDAQLGSLPGLATSALQIIATPHSPGANEIVNLEAKSYTANLNAMDITWYANGAVIAAGYGKRTATVTLGAIGSETPIRVVGKISGTTIIESTLILRPSEVHLIIEADSTAPFWYVGRRLPSPRGSVRIAAFPSLSGSFATLNPKRLLYTWQLNNSNTIARSGIGEQVFSLALPKAPSAITRVVVTISDPRGTYSTKGSLHVGAADPHIALYSNASYSMGRSAITSMITLRPEDAVGLIAEPFYTDVKSVLTYIWKSNGQNIPNNDGKNNAVLLTMPASPSAYTIVSSITNNANVFERASTQLQLKVE